MILLLALDHPSPYFCLLVAPEAKCDPAMAPTFALLTIVLATLKSVYTVRRVRMRSLD